MILAENVIFQCRFSPDGKTNLVRIYFYIENNKLCIWQSWGKIWLKEEKTIIEENIPWFSYIIVDPNTLLTHPLKELREKAKLLTIGENK